MIYIYIYIMYIYNVILIDDMYQGDNDFCWWPILIDISPYISLPILAHHGAGI